MAHSLSSSGVSSCNSLDRYVEDDSDEEQSAFISFTTTESKCEQLHQLGLELKHDGDLHESLSSFLKCLEGMQECQYFAKLPQTLHQLSDLYSSLNCSDEAADCARAEKLFYEAITKEPQIAKDGGARTKRRPFSKKPKPASAVHNPAEYGAVLDQKANEYERLARVCANEGKFDLALENCGKAVCIRKSVYGQNHHLTVASQDYFQVLCKKGETGDIHTSGHGSKGDLTNSAVSLAPCGDALTSLSDNILLHQPQYANMTSKDSSTQTENNLHCGESSNLLSNTRGIDSQDCGSDQRSVFSSITPTNEYREGSEHNNIQETSSRQTEPQTWDKVQSWDYRSDLNHGAPYSLGLGLAQEKVISSHPHQEINLCTGVTNNLTKLKSPMCMNLDPHQGLGPGEGEEHTRCLPMWLLMLPAFLALVAYMLYYH